MPKMGDAMEEGRVVQWRKKVGDTIAVGDVLLEIETDKSNVEIEAEEAGTLQSISVDEGAAAPVGSVIAVIGSGAAPAAPKEAAPATPPKEAPPAAPTASGNGAGPAAAPEVPESAPAPAPPAPAPAAAPVAAQPRPAAAAPAYFAPVPAFTPYDSFVGALPENLGGTASVVGEPILDGGTAAAGAAERVRATPVARAMAQSHGLDLGALRGSGPDGGITKRDVEAALAGGTAAAAPQPAPVAAAPAPAAPAPAPVAVAEGDEVQEYNAMRRTIARRLAESKATIPHFYVTSEIDVEALFALREQVNGGAGGAAAGQPKITLTDFLVKAAAGALVAHPTVNSAFSDNKRILRKGVHVGIAVSIEDGLIVPVIRDCQSKNLRAISGEARGLIERARTMKLKPEEYTGGTFTISNLGQYDVENFAAIINPGEAAILAVSSIRPVAAVVDGQIVARRRMKVTLCADHRVMDGVAGALFLQELKRVIENPLQILA